MSVTGNRIAPPATAACIVVGLVLLVGVERLLPGAAAWDDEGAPQSASGREAGRLSVPVEQFTLDNGLHVILHEDHSVPIVSVNIWYHVGSARERPGRTGFAHLFEHLMFEGSGHVPEGDFDLLLEGAGGTNNGSTNTDRTNYYIDVPSNALDLALFLESDRMGFLLDAMTPAKVDAQRDVVKNERRQNVENVPYGQAGIELDRLLYPDGHPYSWPTIGSMEDLSAATYDDVVSFFKSYYVPNNASLVVAGDIDIVQARAAVTRWFGDIPKGLPVPPLSVTTPPLRGVIRTTLEDRVQLPRLYLAWLTPPTLAPGDAELDMVAQILAGGKNSRLYRRLVYDLQIAQDVDAFQQSAALSSSFVIVVTARPSAAQAGSDPVARVLAVVDEELDRLRREEPSPREVERARNQVEAAFLDAMEHVGGFGGKADLLNGYYMICGNPDYFDEDLARYRSLTADDLQAAVTRYLPRDRRVELTVVPRPEKEKETGQ